MPIFDPTLLSLFATEVAPSVSECTKRLAVLERLRRIRDEGTLLALTETRVEQSFNERIFAEVFDYRTLLRDGDGAYHLQPKEYSASSMQFDDLSLGFFGKDGTGHRVVSAELKGFKIDLDAPSSRGDKATAVEQAHSAIADVPSVQWVIVSDYNEVRLYRARDQTAFERIVLTELDTVDDFRRAYSLLGRHSLLGEPGEASPLQRLWEKRETRMLSAKNGSARLIHEASVNESTLEQLRSNPTPLHQLDDALRGAFREITNGYRGSMLPWWPPHQAAYSMKLESGKLGYKEQTREGTTTVEASPSGIIRVCEHIGTPQGNSTALQAESVAGNMAAFVHFAGRSLSRGTGSGQIRFRWFLEDVEGALIGAPHSWGVMRTLRSSTPRGSSPWIAADFSGQTAETFVPKLHGAFRELVFPFEATSAVGEILRLTPSLQTFGKQVEASLTAALSPGPQGSAGNAD